MPGTHRVIHATDYQSILLYCSKQYKDGRLKYGTLNEAGCLFGLHCSTICKIWQHWHNSFGTAGGNHTHHHILHILRHSNSQRDNQRPVLYDHHILHKIISRMPVWSCTTIQDIAEKVYVSPSTIH